MSKATVELDFFGLERINSQRSSIRRIQSAMSRINPTLLRSVMETPRPQGLTGAGANRTVTPSVPVLNPASSRPVNESPPGTAPLTIFYNGTVTVFHVGHDEAKAIIRTAEGKAKEDGILDKLNGDLPMARKKSLQRFLEKRKERLAAMAPYASEIGAAGSTKKTEEMESTTAPKPQQPLVAACYCLT